MVIVFEGYETMQDKSINMKGQQQSPLELVSTNVRAVLKDVINKLQCGDYVNIIDFTWYKIDWLCSLLLRFGDH